MKNKQRYLGDGVYALFDGFGIEIRVNDHRNPVAVYLEPQVIQQLNDLFEERNKSEESENPNKSKTDE